MYYVIGRYEDELWCMYISTKKELVNWLNSDGFEGLDIITTSGYLNQDLSYFPSMTIAIIEGKLIEPKPKEAVITWEV